MVRLTPDPSLLCVWERLRCLARGSENADLFPFPLLAQILLGGPVASWWLAEFGWAWQAGGISGHWEQCVPSANMET